MPKTVMVTVTEEVPDTELAKDATVTVGTNTYHGKVMAIITHGDIPATSTVSLEGVGLKTA